MAKREHGGYAEGGKASDVEAKQEKELEGEYEHRADGGKAGKHPTHAGHRHASHGMELMNEGPHPGHKKDPFHPGHKDGGAPHTTMESKHEKVQEYNAHGSNEMAEAGDETPGFKKGGKPHHRRRSGGHASGSMAEHRLDRRPRRAQGGRTENHNPYSSAAKMETPETDEAGRGMEGKVHKP